MTESKRYAATDPYPARVAGMLMSDPVLVEELRQVYGLRVESTEGEATELARLRSMREALVRQRDQLAASAVDTEITRMFDEVLAASAAPVAELIAELNVEPSPSPLTEFRDHVRRTVGALLTGIQRECERSIREPDAGAARIESLGRALAAIPRWLIEPFGARMPAGLESGAVLRDGPGMAL